MNLASVLNISAPAGAVIQNSNAVEGGAGFDALMETVATPDAAAPVPAPAAKADISSGSQSPVDALVALFDSNEAAALKLPAAAAAAVPVTVSAAALDAEPEQPVTQPQPTIDAPPAVRDLALRASAKVAKDGAADLEKLRAAEPGKGVAQVKQDVKQVALPVVAALSKELVKPVDSSDEDTEEPEITALQSDETAELTSKIQIAQAPQIAASIAQPVETFSNTDTASDRARLELGTDTQKAPEASAALTKTVKTVQVEPSVQAFTLPTPTVVSTTSMTAPVFGGPDNLTTHHLDLARDSQWIDQLARDIVAVAGQDGKLRFGLSPSNLGQLEVSVETKQDGINIHMQASTEAAARIFAAEQPKLVEELRQSGVRVTNSDLLGGQQMQGQRDQSRPQNSAGQASAQLTSNLNSNRTSTHNQNTSRNGRFA